MPVDPIPTEILFKKIGQLWSDPGGSMYSIRDGRHRYLVFKGIRPNRLPHPASHAAMQFTDAIATACQIEGENGHIESFLMFAQGQELFFRDTQIVPVTGKMFFHHGKGECVVSCCHRSMCGEYTGCTNSLGRFIKPD